MAGHWIEGFAVYFESSDCCFHLLVDYLIKFVSDFTSVIITNRTR